MAPSVSDVVICWWLYSAQSLMLLRNDFIKKRQKRRWWVRKLFRERDLHGFNNTLIPELQFNDREYYIQFLRMSPELFEYLLSKIERNITKKNTRWREAISARDRLAVTLRFLATGETFRSLSFSFRIGRSTIAKIIEETTKVIWNNLKNDYMKMPDNENEWKAIAKGFESRWQLPHCCGSIDGKHILVQCPKNSGSLNYNYKGSFSKILLAVTDYEYKFISVEFCFMGGESDGGIFQRSSFGKKLSEEKLNLPNENILLNSNKVFPYFFVGDEAFPLKKNLMRPYPRRSAFTHPQKVFNYRLSRARRIVENAFGILSVRFRIFKRPLNYSEKTIERIVAAALVLHNFLLTENASIYNPPGFSDYDDDNFNFQPGLWRQDGNINSSHCSFGSNMHGINAKSLRDKLAIYLCNEGSVPWQNSKIYPGVS
ncbi:uncharacterized protein [Centruroides vittatus]|uniref:uncharacterized protein n=1 Tax=Centruroides vittatus TaxID=120091 RepID=UPI00350ED982